MISNLEKDSLVFFSGRQATQQMLDKINELVDGFNKVAEGLENLEKALGNLDNEVAAITEVVFESPSHSGDLDS